MPVISDLIPGLSNRIDVAKLDRYGAVSVIATTTSLLVLGVLVGVLAAPAGWSNVVATAVGTVPSFELNRRWVWRRRGHRSLVSELVPFAVLSFAGLALSTLAVQLAASATNDWPRLWHTVAVELANIGAFGSLWVLQFVLLDRVLFRRRKQANTDVEVPRVEQSSAYFVPRGGRDYPGGVSAGAGPRGRGAVRV